MARLKIANPIVGQKFGMLTVIDGTPRKPKRDIAFLCRCDCGSEKVVLKACLFNGHSRSCGCLHRNQLSNRMTKHGHARHGKRTDSYSVWKSMRMRCLNPNHRIFRYYGGNGVKICERWLGENGFENFIADMGERPSRQYSIDRYPKKDGDYEPGNCRWATDVEQARNKRNNRMIEYQGVSLCAAEWSEKVGISQQAIYQRLKAGWSVEHALTIPTGRNS